MTGDRNERDRRSAGKEERGLRLLDDWPEEMP
jgi:hypothetical protein